MSTLPRSGLRRDLGTVIFGLASFAVLAVVVASLLTTPAALAVVVGLAAAFTLPVVVAILVVKMATAIVGGAHRSAGSGARKLDPRVSSHRETTRSPARRRAMADGGEDVTD